VPGHKTVAAGRVVLQVILWELACLADVIVGGRPHMQRMTAQHDRGKRWLRPSIPRGCRPWAPAIAILSMLSFFPPVLAQVSQPELPPNTLACDGFKKTPDGTWYAEKSASFHVGDGKEVTAERQVIGPGSHTIGGIDLYLLLERKCARARG
jgi:hypothetical protein